MGEVTVTKERDQGSHLGERGGRGEGREKERKGCSDAHRDKEEEEEEEEGSKTKIAGLCREEPLGSRGGQVGFERCSEKLEAISALMCKICTLGSGVLNQTVRNPLLG